MNTHTEHRDKEYLLAAHIGGTKARLGLFERKPRTESEWPPKWLFKKRYSIEYFFDSFPLFQAFINEALEQPSLKSPNNSKIKINKACIAVAGPVENNTCKMSNWKWLINGDFLEDKLSIGDVKLINDFEAVAYGVECLEDDENLILQKDTSQPVEDKAKNKVEDEDIKPVVVIGAATGMGKSLLVKWDKKDVPLVDKDDQITTYATEGGHTNFTPHSPLEFALLEYILHNVQDNVKNEEQKPLQRVSIERLISGRGIVAIYRFLQNCQDFPDQIPWLREDSSEILINAITKGIEEAKGGLRKIKPDENIKKLINNWVLEDERCRENLDPAAVIASAALNKSDPLCIYAMQIFLRLYAVELRNSALQFLPQGGLYMAGGITPQILPLIRDEKNNILTEFGAEKDENDELKEILNSIPLYVPKNLEAGLIGAAYYAQNKVKEKPSTPKKTISSEELIKIDKEAVAKALGLKVSKVDLIGLYLPTKKEKTPQEKTPFPMAIIDVRKGALEEFILKKIPEDNTGRVLETKGGKAYFGVRSLEEFELMEYIKKDRNIKFVSVEEVLSEGGIEIIYQFLLNHYSNSERSQLFEMFKTALKHKLKKAIKEIKDSIDIDNIAEVDQKTRKIEEIKDFIDHIDSIPGVDDETRKIIEKASNKTDEIIKAASEKRDLLCLKTMVMFTEAYGSEVGNFALRLLCYEGIYLSGKIVKILDQEIWLRKLFLKEVQNKGRMTKKVLERIPIYLLKSESSEI